MTERSRPLNGKRRGKGIERYREGYQTHGILAIPIAGEGVIDPGMVRKLETNAIPEVPSPICKEGLVYFVKNGGVLTCLDVDSGDARLSNSNEGQGHALRVAGDRWRTPPLRGGRWSYHGGSNRP